MASVVLQISGLDPPYPTENNMFQLIAMNQLLLLFYMVYRKVESLVHFCFLYTSIT